MNPRAIAGVLLSFVLLCSGCAATTQSDHGPQMASLAYVSGSQWTMVRNSEQEKLLWTGLRSAPRVVVLFCTESEMLCGNIKLYGERLSSDWQLFYIARPDEGEGPQQTWFKGLFNRFLLSSPKPVRQEIPYVALVLGASDDADLLRDAIKTAFHGADAEHDLAAWMEKRRQTIPQAMPDSQDSDGDGIPDKKDGCPREPEDLDGFQDSDGCPDVDNDNDDVPDAFDKCPNEAEDLDGFEDDDGCPDPDNDRDQILDGEDKCPEEPETLNGFDDADGCPDEGPLTKVRIVGDELVLLQRTSFRQWKAAILPQNQNTLDQVASVLRLHPEILELQIQGHADNEEGEGAVQLVRLSERRAAEVKAYLVDQGVDPRRLQARGFGAFRPLVPNRSDKDREINRRIQFRIVKKKTRVSSSISGRSAFVCRIAGDEGDNVDASKKANWTWLASGEHPDVQDESVARWWSCFDPPARIDALHEDRSHCEICEWSAD